MKIVQIGVTYVGAQKKIETAIHNYLKDHGHQSYILYAQGESEDSDVIRYENRIDNYIRRGLRKYIGKNPHFAYLSTIKLIQKVKALSPDLIHLHIMHHGYIDYPVLLRFLAKLNIPIVITQHDMWWFTGGCYYYTDAKCDHYLSECSNCPKLTADIDCNAKITSKMQKEKLELLHQIKNLTFVDVSDWVYNESMKSKINVFPHCVVWNGLETVDCENFSKCEKSDDKFRIVGVAASWGMRKGIERFFELATLLGNRYNIVLVGNADETIRSTAPGNITFLGPIYDKNKLNEQYALADIHVSMSMEETFGMTFVEAALMGTRSVGFNSSAVPYVLRKVGGYVIESNSVEDMAYTVRSICQGKEKKSLCDNEIDTISEIFSQDRMAAAYADVYSQALIK